MQLETNNPVVEAVTIAEAARQIGACRMTLDRHIASKNVQPDIFLVEGSRRSKLFVVGRLPELERLIKP